MMKSELNKRTLASGAKGKAPNEMEHDEVLRVLAKNGMEYVKVEGGMQLIRTVRDDDVKAFFEGFHVDQVRCGCFIALYCLCPRTLGSTRSSRYLCHFRET